MRKRKGFTLIELLIIITIIGLISVAAIVALGSSRRKSRDSKRVDDMKQIQMALELHYSELGYYPSHTTMELGGGDDCGSACLYISTNGITDENGTIGAIVYMSRIPADPSGTTPLAQECKSESTNTCSYSYTGGGNSYCIQFYLEGEIGKLGSPIGTLAKATQDGIANGACP